MRRLLAVLVIIGCSIASAQPVPQPGLTKVIHDSSMTGNGTNTSNLGIRTDCSSSQVLVWSGSAWACGSAGITGTGTTNTLAMWTSSTALGDSPLAYNGSTTLSTSKTLSLPVIQVATSSNLASATASSFIDSGLTSTKLTRADSSHQLVDSTITDNGTVAQFTHSGAIPLQVDYSSTLKWSVSPMIVSNTDPATITVFGQTVTSMPSANSTLNFDIIPGTGGAGGVNLSPNGPSYFDPDAYAAQALTLAIGREVPQAELDVADPGNSHVTDPSRQIWTIVNAEETSSFDTTAQGVVVRALNGDCQASRSAGSNALTCIGGDFNAGSSPTATLAIRTRSGDNEFNATAGKSTFDRDAWVNGDSHLGNDSGDTTTVTGTGFFAGTVRNTLINYVPIGENTYIRAGQTASHIYIGDVNTGAVYLGSSVVNDSNPTVVQYNLSFDADSNSATTGTINAVGYQLGTTQFRNIEIDDGKGSAIALFTGSGHRIVFGGGSQFSGTTLDTFNGITPTTTTGVAIVESDTHTANESIPLFVGNTAGMSYDTTGQPSTLWLVDAEIGINHSAGSNNLTVAAFHCDVEITAGKLAGDVAQCLNASVGAGIISVPDGAQFGGTTQFGALTQTIQTATSGAEVDDFALNADTTIVSYTPTADLDWTGIAQPTVFNTGSARHVTIQNNSDTKVITFYQNNAGSSAVDRLFLGNEDSLWLLRPACEAQFDYVTSRSRWFLSSWSCNSYPKLYVGKTTATQQVIDGSSGTPSPDHGSIGTGSTNFAGNVTSIGANAVVTLTLGGSGFPTRSFCTANTNANTTPEYIVVGNSNTAPTFSCFNSTLGTSANCDDFTYVCIGQ